MGRVNRTDVDCLVIGGGLSGFMAAREAIQRGLSVCMLQDGMGASPWVHGLCIPLHPDDSPACYLTDTLRSGQGLSDPALARALCLDAPDMLCEIERMGLSINCEAGAYQLLKPLGASHPRVASIGNETGVHILRALHDALPAHMQTMEKTRAVRLCTADGRVCGALAFDTEQSTWHQIDAKAVVLACGGFCGIFPHSTNKRDSGGDGTAMAFFAGAQLCDMEFVQFEPSAAVWPEALLGTSMITTLLYEGAVLRNKHGERFMLRHSKEGERISKDMLSRRIAEEIHCGNGTAHGGVLFDATAVDTARLNTRYESYVRRYRAVGIDLATEWIELAPAPHTSLGGVRIDAHGSTSLPGLFACGEVTGGLHGASRIGGSAGLETLVFGKRAGQSAAEYAMRTPLAHAKCHIPQANGAYSQTECLHALRKQMQEALHTGANVLRHESTLRAAMETLAQCRHTLSGMAMQHAKEAYLRMRLENDITTAQMVLCSASMREDSTGCHARTDHPRSMQSPYRVLLHKSPDGSMAVRKEAIV